MLEVTGATSWTQYIRETSSLERKLIQESIKAHDREREAKAPSPGGGGMGL